MRALSEGELYEGANNKHERGYGYVAQLEGVLVNSEVPWVSSYSHHLGTLNR